MPCRKNLLQEMETLEELLTRLTEASGHAHVLASLGRNCLEKSSDNWYRTYAMAEEAWSLGERLTGVLYRLLCWMETNEFVSGRTVRQTILDSHNGARLIWESGRLLSEFDDKCIRWAMALQ